MILDGGDDGELSDTDYIFSECLGTGAFARVYLAQAGLASSELVAVKEVLPPPPPMCARSAVTHVCNCQLTRGTIPRPCQVLKVPSFASSSDYEFLITRQAAHE